MIDQIKDITGQVVGGLKDSPLLLGVLVLNLMMIGGLVWIMIEVGQANTARFQTLLDRCLPGGPT
jgi:hypothetical protein